MQESILLIMCLNKTLNSPGLNLNWNNITKHNVFDVFLHDSDWTITEHYHIVVKCEKSQCTVKKKSKWMRIYTPSVHSVGWVFSAE